MEEEDYLGGVWHWLHRSCLDYIADNGVSTCTRIGYICLVHLSLHPGRRKRAVSHRLQCSTASYLPILRPPTVITKPSSQ